MATVAKNTAFQQVETSSRTGLSGGQPSASAAWVKKQQKFCSGALRHLNLHPCGLGIVAVCRTTSDTKDTLKSKMSGQSVRTKANVYVLFAVQMFSNQSEYNLNLPKKKKKKTGVGTLNIVRQSTATVAVL